jgi:hypothetical protein
VGRNEMTDAELEMVYFEYGYADEPKFEGCFEILKQCRTYLLDKIWIYAIILIG